MQTEVKAYKIDKGHSEDQRKLWDAIKKVFSTKTFNCNSCGKESDFDFRMTEIYVSTDAGEIYLIARCKHCKEKGWIDITLRK